MQTSDEGAFRRQVVTAFDAVTPGAPWLESTVLSGLRQRRSDPPARVLSTAAMAVAAVAVVVAVVLLGLGATAARLHLLQAQSSASHPHRTNVTQPSPTSIAGGQNEALPDLDRGQLVPATGETQLTISDGSPTCNWSFDGPVAPCRRVHVVVPSEGSLRAAVTGSEPGVSLSVGIGGYCSCYASAVRNVKAGEDVVVEVFFMNYLKPGINLPPAPGTHSFVLRTDFSTDFSPRPATTAPPLVPAVTGATVDGTGAALAGVAIQLWDGHRWSASAVSDERGDFTLKAAAGTDLVGGFELSASKAGYDSGVLWVSGGVPVTLRLYPSTTIHDGETASLALAPDDLQCELGADGVLLPCRGLHVVVRSAGTLTLTASAEPGVDARIVLQPWTEVPCPGGCGPSVSVNVSAGQQFALAVVLWNDPARDPAGPGPHQVRITAQLAPQ